VQPAQYSQTPRVAHLRARIADYVRSSRCWLRNPVSGVMECLDNEFVSREDIRVQRGDGRRRALVHVDTIAALADFIDTMGQPPETVVIAVAAAALRINIAVVTSQHDTAAGEPPERFLGSADGDGLPDG
jgi:hypothetical protein